MDVATAPRASSIAVRAEIESTMAAFKRRYGDACATENGQISLGEYLDGTVLFDAEKTQRVIEAVHGDRARALTIMNAEYRSLCGYSRVLTVDYERDDRGRPVFVLVR